MESSGATTSNTLSNAGMYLFLSLSIHARFPIVSLKLSVLTHWPNSLEKEQPRRATPWRMLEHPWMVEMEGKKVKMANFLEQVWGWKEINS